MRKCLVTAVAALALMGAPAHASSHGGGDAAKMITAAKAEYGKAKAAHQCDVTGTDVKPCAV